MQYQNRKIYRPDPPAVSPFSLRQNTLPSSYSPYRHQNVNTKPQMTYKYPYKRTFDAQTQNIDKISTQISELLCYVKNKNEAKENNKQKQEQKSNRYSNNSQFHQYRRRILQLQRMQQQHQGELNSVPSSRNLSPFNQRIHRQPSYNRARTRQYQLIAESVRIKQIEDYIPISRPSYANLISIQPIHRDRSPLLSHPAANTSKYLQKRVERQIEKHKSLHSQKQFLPHDSHRDLKQIKKIVPIYEQSSDAYTSKNHQSNQASENYKSKQEKKSSTQNQNIKVTDEYVVPQKIKVPETPYRYLDESQLLPQSTKRNTQIDQLADHQQQTKSIVQIISPNDIPQSHSYNFTLRVYPCDINKDNVNNFIANKLAIVVKRDMQLMELKQIFMNNKVGKGYQLIQKRKQLTKVLWGRGLRVDEPDLDYTLDMNVDAKQLSEKQVEFYNNFHVFLQTLVDKYLEAEYEWENKVVEMLTQNELGRSFFTPSHLDLQNRGYIKLEDLTCFVNLHADNSPCFKNKNVQQLFLRFCRIEPSDQRLSYQTFMATISRRV